MQAPEDDQDRLVFVPARPLSEPGQQGFELEFRRFTDGERFGLAFSHPAALVEALGAYQPWICLPMRNVVAMLQLVGVRRLEIDPQLDDTVWRWDAGALQDVLGEAS
jgi:hypothetical protein